MQIWNWQKFAFNKQSSSLIFDVFIKNTKFGMNIIEASLHIKRHSMFTLNQIRV